MAGLAAAEDELAPSAACAGPSTFMPNRTGVTMLLDSPELVTVTDADAGTFADAGELAHPPFAAADEAAMIADCAATGMVRGLAWRQFHALPPHCVDLDELVSLGNLGLMAAARGYADYCRRRGLDPHQQDGLRAYATAALPEGRKPRASMAERLQCQPTSPSRDHPGGPAPYAQS